MAWEEPYAKIEHVIVQQTTRTITFPRRYDIGMGDLTVYVNGMLAVRDVDYKEVTPFSIEFSEELHESDVVAGHFLKFW